MRLRLRKDQPTPQSQHVDTYAAGASGSEEAKKMEVIEKGDEVLVLKFGHEIDLYAEDLYKETLTSEARNALPASAFVFPKDRRYPIHNRKHAINALARAKGKPEEGTVNAAVYRKYPDLKKKKTDKMELQVGLWKDEAQHIVYGVVLDPSVTDSQGDDVSKEEIEKAAHRYLIDSRKSDVRHSEEVAKVDLIESYIAQHDLVVAGKLVKEGSWVAAYKVHDPQVWKEVEEGELTGFSIGGSGVRVYAEEAG